MSTVLRPKFFFFALYFLVLSIVFYDTRLPQDAYYYWQWSQHLQLSYFDGPPLIAYVLRLYTMVFGAQEFVLLSFSFMLSILTSWILWRTAILFFDKTTADYALFIWLLSPGILYFFTLQITYNTLMIFFWSLSFYAFGNLLLKQKTRYYYYCGFSFGFLLLAQYSGWLLLVSLLFFCIYYKKYHFIFKTQHFYWALLAVVFIFSPVLIWNYQHHWASFLFQLNHGFHPLPTTDHVYQIKVYLLRNLACYNISLLALIWVILKNRRSILKSSLHGVFLFPTLFVFFFFCISAYFAPTQNNWSAPFFFTGSILLASYLAPNHPYTLKPLQQTFLYSFLLLSSAALIFEEGFTQTKWLKSMVNCRRGEGVPAAVKVLATHIPPAYLTKPIFVDRYQLGAHLAYFLHPSPLVYAATPEAHQYYFWWLQEKNTHGNQSLSNGFVYMSHQALKTNDGFLQNCSLEKKLTTMQKQLWKPDVPLNLFIYTCKTT